MARAQNPPLDPTADAAALLRRVGFAALMLAVPAATLVTKRGLVVLIPAGAVLLVLAAALDGLNRPAGVVARGTLRSPGALAALVLLAWCALSLAWTPSTREAAERFVSIAGTVGVALAGFLALPDRTRVANLYLLPIGVAAAALLAVAIGLSGWSVGRSAEEAAIYYQRGLVVLVLLFWPALSWLRSRGRDREAMALTAAVASAVVVGGMGLPAVALGLGALVYGGTLLDPRRGVRVTGWIVAAALALAPLVPFLGRPILHGLAGPGAAASTSLGIWRDVILAEPLRLVTGRGFGTVLRNRLAGLLPPDAPTTPLFEIWYELGLVGALAGAVALFALARAAGRQHPVLVPGMMAALVSALAFAAAGISTTQMWWFTALAGLVLVFVSCTRGQFRTRRPKVAAAPEIRKAA